MVGNIYKPMFKNKNQVFRYWLYEIAFRVQHYTDYYYLTIHTYSTYSAVKARRGRTDLGNSVFPENVARE